MIRSRIAWSGVLLAVSLFAVAGGGLAARAQGATPAEAAPAGDQTTPPRATPAATPQQNEAAPAEGQGTAPSEATGATGATSPDGRATPRAPSGAAEPASETSAPPLPELLRIDTPPRFPPLPAPTEDQARTLAAMEAAVAQFSERGSVYQSTVGALLRDDYLRQRRGRSQWYGRQIRSEEDSLREARQDSITMFETFLRRYPHDARYTPDAMFRLGELYFERSAIAFQDAYAAAQRGETSGAALPETPDFDPTIDLYSRLVAEFPSYDRLDGAYYLIGYCLHEMGRGAEALNAWLALTCHNKVAYHPAAPPAPEPDAADAPEKRQSPALTLDGSPEPPAGPYVDPYQGCEPVFPDARFVSESWFRIGEYHFDDYRDPHSIDKAISAYDHIVAHPDDRNYNLALYKVAWAYYRASDYPQAIRSFAALVQWSDEERARTGRAGSQLRPEAIQYLAISFAYDDWNENQVPDVDEGGKSPLERIQDPTLLPQDRPWTREVYYQLGQVLFDDAKYPEAVAAWRLALKKWPNDPAAPSAVNQIAIAYQRHNDFAEAIAARAELANYAAGTPWWEANADHPAERREAATLAQDALVATAIYHHQAAQQLRRRCVASRDVRLCREAKDEYGLAADAYRDYLDKYPNQPEAYELQFNLADALYWSQRYEDAAKEYAAVRDSNLDDSHMSEAARRVVESYKRLLDAAEDMGKVAVRKEPPKPSGTPPAVHPVQMPELVEQVAKGRELYLLRVPPAEDKEHLRDAYAFNNAMLLYWYGYWPQAQERLAKIFDERCSGSSADPTGQVAWLNLRAMAVAQGDDARIAALGEELQKRQCTFGSGQRVASSDCSDPNNRDKPFCLMLTDRNALQYRSALKVYQSAEGATGAEQQRLYEQAATMLVDAVNRNTGDPQAPIALEYAATALERTNRFDSAATLYQRIIDEVGPRKAASPEEQERLDDIVGNAYFKVAKNAQQVFEFNRAVDNYRILADSKRFADSQSARVAEWRTDALVNTAVLLEQLGRHREATTYYRRVYDTVSDPALKQRALYRVAEMAFKDQRWDDAVRGMEAFIRAYGNDGAAGELVVQARWRIAEARKAQGRTRDYEAALRDVVRDYDRLGQQPGSMAAEYAAQARFLLANDRIGSFEKLAIESGRQADLKAAIAHITDRIQDASKTAKGIVDGYDPVLTYRRPVWTIAAYVQQGRVYEVLARAVLSTKFTMPRDLERKLKRVSRDDREDIRIQVQDSVQQALDAKVGPIECFALARYALAARAGRAGDLDTQYTRTAIDRLQAYGEERIAQCIADARAKDPSFAAYQPGEFARAPRGKLLSVPTGAVAPPLAAEEK